MDNIYAGMFINYASLVSSVLCSVLAFFLLDVKSYKQRVKEICPTLVPQRYINARLLLGIAYLVMGLFSALQLLRDNLKVDSIYVSVIPLLIISLQAILFTGAFLSFYNSPKANHRLVWGNIIPVGVLLLLFMMLNGNEMSQQQILTVWTILYLVQLSVFTLLVSSAMEHYHKALTECFGNLPIKKQFEQKTLFPMFLAGVSIGIFTLFHAYSRNEWIYLSFVVSYSIYYTIFGIYTLKYSKLGHYIKDISESVDNVHKLGDSEF